MKKLFIRSFLIALVIFIFAYGALFAMALDGFKFMANDTNTSNSNQGNNTTPIRATVRPEDEEEIVEIPFENNAVNFLMVGVDSVDEDTDGSRTDTIILVRVDFNEGDLNLLSIPRDTRLMVKGSLDKVNHAHHYGGIDLTLKSINDYLGTDVEHYVKMDYRAVKEIVDAIGGVDINVPRNMQYYDPTVKFRVDLKKGQQILDGEKSLQFLRWRTNNAKTLGYFDGDLGRIATQQYFLKEFMKQLLQPKNIIKLPSMVNTYYKYVDTNITMEDIIKSIAQVGKLDIENMRTETIPGTDPTIDGVSYFTPYKNQTLELVRDMGFLESEEDEVEEDVKDKEEEKEKDKNK